MTRTKSMIYKETNESRELSLYAENTASIWNRAIQPVIDNLTKKVAKGVYDSEKAIIACFHVMTAASNMYKKEYGYSFSVGDRWTAATDLRDYIEAEYLN